MKNKMCIVILSVLLFMHGCAKDDDIAENSIYSLKNTDEYTEIADSEPIFKDNETLEETLSNGNYIIDFVIDRKFGSFIAENEKFWISAYHKIEDTEQEYEKVYILTDSREYIYSVLNSKIIPEHCNVAPISEDALVIYDELNNEKASYIIDGKGNDITLKYVNEGERILEVNVDDNGVHIFTILVEENFSEQNIIFKIYDDKKNCEISFTKGEIEDKYGIEWNCRAESLGISYLDNNTYCITNKISSSIHSYIDVLGENVLYIDTTRKKAFLMILPQGGAGISDGNYIMRENQSVGNCVIDIDNETFESLNWIEYRDGHTYRYSNLYNGKFIARPYDSELYAIYDIYGNLICDLESDVVNVTACTDFYDGYALIEITNEGGTSFITIIDENGEWQFEPILGKANDKKLPYFKTYLKATGQFLALKNDESAIILIDKSGKQEELPPIGHPSFVMEIDGELQYLCYINEEVGYIKRAASSTTNSN